MEAENDKKHPKKQYINLNISAIKNAKYILQKVQSKKRHLVCKIKKKSMNQIQSYQDASFFGPK